MSLYARYFPFGRDPLGLQTCGGGESWEEWNSRRNEEERNMTYDERVRDNLDRHLGRGRYSPVKDHSSDLLRRFWANIQKKKEECRTGKLCPDGCVCKFNDCEAMAQAYDLLQRNAVTNRSLRTGSKTLQDLAAHGNEEGGFHWLYQEGSTGNQVRHFAGYARGALTVGVGERGAKCTAFVRELMIQEYYQNSGDEGADYRISAQAGRFAEAVRQHEDLGDWIRDHICDPSHRGELYWCEPEDE
jgi:hypothetical protein